MWKKLYHKQSAGQHGTLRHFQALLQRNTVNANVKKAVDANLEFLHTVFKGLILSEACKILELKPGQCMHLPPSLTPSRAPHAQRLQHRFIHKIASEIVDRCTLIDSCRQIVESKDGVYNYTRVLGHYCGLVTEFRDALAEGDGERVYRCWRLMLPHFKSTGRTKYSLEAKVRAIASPRLAHQVKWDRFVNTHGGLGRNIPCDLYNEHVVRLVKDIIGNMGANLTENALQRAARSITTLDAVCEQFDSQSKVPVKTSAHATRDDTTDITKVVKTIQDNDLLNIIQGRSHRTFAKIRLNPLWNWDRIETLEWISKK